ncbi:MAG TPA: DUF3108 domain-containing protein [Bacteroidales bacterium]|nr:DUF3108 domain-containing protein [Bacteroidales bacterium]
MKPYFFLAFYLLLIPLISLSQELKLRTINNTAFQRGEKLVFRAYYDAILTGKVTAGEVTLEITNENKKINGRNTYHIVGVGETKGLFNLFFKVVDRYESYVDEEAIVPWVFIRRVNEGGYIINQDVMFNHAKKLAISNTATVPVPEYIQDVISTFYYARTMDISHLQLGQYQPIDFFIDDTVYNSHFIYLGIENVKTSIGTIRCYKVKPKVAKGIDFKEDYPMILYVSADKNRIPILGESKVIVGSVKLELIKYSGLKNPFEAKIK